MSILSILKCLCKMNKSPTYIESIDNCGKILRPVSLLTRLLLIILQSFFRQGALRAKGSPKLWVCFWDQVANTYLRKVDCSRYISWSKIHLEEKALVAGTKQSRETQLPCQACPPCWPYKTKQGRLYVPLISLFLM